MTTEEAVTILIQTAFIQFGGKGKTGVRVLREKNEKSNQDLNNNNHRRDDSEDVGGELEEGYVVERR